MQLTVIIPDKAVVLDGEGINFDFQVADVDVEVIQWDGDALLGTVQRKSGTEPFRDPSIVKPYLDAYVAERVRRAQDALQKAQQQATAATVAFLTEKAAAAALP